MNKTEKVKVITFTSVVVSQLHFKDQACNLSPHVEKTTPLHCALLQEM